jgi:hypothetical protein
MRGIGLLLVMASLGACATGPQPARSAQAENHLQKLLAGRVAGPPVACLSDYRTQNLVVIDDRTILYRDGRTYYRNDFNGGACENLRIGNALVTKRFGGTGLCRGDIAQVVDFSSGFTVGSCQMGDFVPYTKPRG